MHLFDFFLKKIAIHDELIQAEAQLGNKDSGYLWEREEEQLHQ